MSLDWLYKNFNHILDFIFHCSNPSCNGRVSLKSNKCAHCGTEYNRLRIIYRSLFLAFITLIFGIFAFGLWRFVRSCFEIVFIIIRAIGASPTTVMLLLCSVPLYIALRKKGREQNLLFSFFCVVLCSRILSQPIDFILATLFISFVCLCISAKKTLSELASKYPALHDKTFRFFVYEYVPQYISVLASCFAFIFLGQGSLIFVTALLLLLINSKKAANIVQYVLMFCIGAGLVWSCIRDMEMLFTTLVIGAIYLIIVIFQLSNTSSKKDKIDSVPNILALMMKYNGGLTEKSRNATYNLFIQLNINSKEMFQHGLKEIENSLANPNINITHNLKKVNFCLTYKDKISVVEALFNISAQNENICKTGMELLDQIMNSFKISAKKRAELIKKYQKYFVGFQWGEAGAEEKEEQKREQKRHERETSENGLLQNVSEAFALLGLKPGTDFYEVKRTYRRLAMKNHPDKFANAPEAEHQAANIRMRELNKAFATIEKHAKR